MILYITDTSITCSEYRPVRESRHDAGSISEASAFLIIWSYRIEISSSEFFLAMSEYIAESSRLKHTVGYRNKSV